MSVEIGEIRNDQWSHPISLQWDLDDFERVETKIFHVNSTRPDEQRWVQKLNEGLNQLNINRREGLWGGLHFQLKNGKVASHWINEAVSYQPGDHDFTTLLPFYPPMPALTPGSQQANSVDDIKSARQVYIFGFLQAGGGSSVFRFDEFCKITGPVRQQARTGARNDWWFTLHSKYEMDHKFSAPFKQFPGHDYSTWPEKFPWLEQRKLRNHDNPTSAYLPVWPTEKCNVNRKVRFSSPASYSQVFVPAILWEMEKVAKDLRAQFNPAREYPAEFKKVDKNTFFVAVNLKGEEPALGGSTVTPTPGTNFAFWFASYTEKTPANQWTARVSEDCPHGYNFGLLATIPQEAPHSLPHDAFVKQIVLEVKVEDRQNDMLKSAVYRAVNTVPDKGFNVSNLFRGWGILPRSELDWFAQWMAQHDNQPPADVLEELTTTLPKPLNREQKQAYFLAIRGHMAGILIVQGFPGTGKSETLSRIIAALLLMGQKVVISAHSNSGACAVFARLVKYAKKSHPEWLKENWLVRMGATSLESSIDIDTDKQPSVQKSKIDPANWPYTLTGLCQQWEKANSNDPLAQASANWRKAKRAAKLNNLRLGDVVKKLTGIGAGTPYADESKVRLLVEGKVLDNARVIAATASITFKFGGEESFPADVLVFDEGSQAVEPALLIPLTAMPTIKQCIIGGDPEQLGPVVNSISENPLGPQLAVSAMERLPLAYPHLPLVKLVNNYRGHPDTIFLSSNLVYRGEMKAGIKNWPMTAMTTDLSAYLKEGGPQNQFAGTNGAHRMYFINTWTSKTVAEPKGTSFFNPKGDQAIVDIISDLLFKVPLLRQSQIVVITMYSYDKQTIARELNEKDMSDVEVATVDSFQGNERELVFVHFPANFDEHEGRTNPWGFTSDEKRLNVAVSRAKEYMFIVGNLSHWLKRISRNRRDQGLKHVMSARNKAMFDMVEFFAGHRDRVVDWEN